ncbi:MAG: ribbon-helix-helix protein, CopG family [Clostridia bacterium]|nr:ribbon-helix-helix protein, CopG family [Clostridia bacterium]
MQHEPIKIMKRGDDGHHLVSVRLRDSIYNRLEELSKETGRSRNELINLILEEGLKNIIIEE